MMLMAWLGLALPEVRLWAEAYPELEQIGEEWSGRGEVELRGEGPYVVPEQVYVVDLPGSGFTGLMDLDELVAGTVTAEEGDSFPYEALKAQAVAARTFALHRLRSRGQANGGQAYTPRVGERSLAAALNTSGVVMLYQGRIIPSYFSARCNGDMTLNSEDGPTLSNCRRGGLGAGWVPWARSVVCSGHVNCSQTTESCCVIEVNGQEHRIYGHGIGMCQRGAQQFAGRDGWSWDTILLHYYTGVELVNGDGFGPGTAVEASATLLVRSAPCGDMSAILPGGMTGVVLSEAVIVPCSFRAPYSHMTWREIHFSNGTTGWVSEDVVRQMDQPVFDPEELIVSIGRRGEAALLSWPLAAGKVRLQESASLGRDAEWREVEGVEMRPAGDRAELELPIESVEARYLRLIRD